MVELMKALVYPGYEPACTYDSGSVFHKYYARAMDNWAEWLLHDAVVYSDKYNNLDLGRIIDEYPEEYKYLPHITLNNHGKWVFFRALFQVARIKYFKKMCRIHNFDYHSLSSMIRRIFTVQDFAAQLKIFYCNAEIVTLLRDKKITQEFYPLLAANASHPIVYCGLYGRPELEFLINCVVVDDVLLECALVCGVDISNIDLNTLQITNRAEKYMCDRMDNYSCIVSATLYDRLVDAGRTDYLSDELRHRYKHCEISCERIVRLISKIYKGRTLKIKCDGLSDLRWYNGVNIIIVKCNKYRFSRFVYLLKESDEFYDMLASGAVTFNTSNCIVDLPYYLQVISAIPEIRDEFKEKLETLENYRGAVASMPKSAKC